MYKDNQLKNLYKAYQNAVYEVLAESSIWLSIGAATPEIRELLEFYGESCGVVITADNPRSVLLDEPLNQLRRGQLSQGIAELELAYLASRHRDPDGKWPVEEGYCVMGMSAEQGRVLGRQFDQYAIVYFDAQQVSLIWLD